MNRLGIRRPTGRKARILGGVVALLLLVSSARADDLFLWEIKGNPSSWLFGTIHLGEKRVLAQVDPMWPVLDGCDAVFTEIAMDPVSLYGMMDGFVRSDGRKLSEVLPEPLVERSEAVLDRMPVPIDMAVFDQFETWAFAVSLGQLVQTELLSAGQPLDMQIFFRGMRNGAETGGLEEPDEQFGVFNELSQDEQLTLLEWSLDELEGTVAGNEDPYEKLIQAYLSGSISAVEREIEFWVRGAGKDVELSDRLFERLLGERDRRMADRIAEKLRANPHRSYFFAVGAAHFVTETGIQRLLRDKGFEVERRSRIGMEEELQRTP